MTKKILIIISLILLSASMSYALDNPHDYTLPFTCDECHDPQEAGWWDSSNMLCLSCHKSGGSAIAEQTHSSENTSTKYGTWDQKCIDCHNPHFQKQLRIYKDPSYLYTGVSTSLTTTTFTQAGAAWEVNQWAGNVLVPDTAYYNFQYRIESNTLDTIILKNKNIISTKYILPNKDFAIIYGKLVREELTTGQKLTIMFFRPAGTNSFADHDADADGIYSGVCEVCHTKAVYHKKNGTGLAHNAATKCTTCHEHKFGFEAVCDGCHDNPPGELAGLQTDNPQPALATGSTTSGMHATHVNTHKTMCEACHYDSVGTGSTHNSGDKNITMGFNPFNGTNAGGTYDGQAGASYNATTTSPLTMTTNGGNKECSDIYCHGATMDPNGGTDTTPIWDIASTGACNTCHGASTTFPPTKGSHSKHAGTSSAQSSLACDVCHKNYTHINTNIEWEFGTDARTAGATYKGAASGSEVMSSFSYGTCDQLYCHSNANPAVNVVSSDPAFSLKNEANDFKTVTWGSVTAMECDSCHEGTLAETTSQPVCSTDFTDFLSKNHTMKSNGHYRLAGPCSGRKYQCRFCHADTMDYVAGKDVITETGKAKHANGIKDVKMSTEWGMVNMPAPSYNSDDLTCDNLYCHSDGTKEGPVGGVTVKPEVRAFPWNAGQTACESCHGHTPGSCTNAGCHDGKLHANDGRFWPYVTGWAEDEEWKGAVPMFASGLPGTDRANSHQRHMEKDFSCDSCHNNTVVSSSGNCNDCHSNGKLGDMGQLGHLNTDFHVNKTKDVDFNSGSSSKYHESQEGDWPAKSCENVVCHDSSSSYITAPIWGGSSFSACIGCHAPGGNDVDDFNWGDDNKDSYCVGAGGTQALLNPIEWSSSGHGRPAVDPGNGIFGNYPISGNPAADFGAKGINACSFCHDSEVLHNDPTNPFRLVFQQQFADRFDKECVYCHMQRLADSSECEDCHVRTNGIYESIAPEATENGILFKQPNGYWVEQYPEHGYTSNCMGLDPVVAGCHDTDIGTFPLPSTAHKGHSEIPVGGEWTQALQDDVRSQYNMMGVCLKCHEEDSNDECQQCHQGPEYSTGFDPDGDGIQFQFVTPQKAKATSVHYGYKHYLQGTQKGGKFCWDCHDPHGDSNIFMIQDKVATQTEGQFGVPVVKMYADGITSLPVVTSTCAADVGGTVVDYRKPVVFTDNAKGADAKTNDPGSYYARTKAWKEAAGGRTYDGICNVCHAVEAAGISRHFGSDYGEIGHHSSQKCTQCHEHRFTSSHAGDKACNSCHGNKPVPSHTAFGLPRDCTKCHKGTIYKRMNIMGQMGANSHHVQGVETTNKHCYACHWEATEDGLINNEILPGTGRIAHEGYNFKTHITVPDAVSDLVIWGRSTTRPTTFELGTTAVVFSATSIGTTTERDNVSKVTIHCLGCHNEAQNDTQPFSEYGICSNSSYYSKNSCTIAGECDNSSYTTEFTCNAAGATWTNFGYTWSADCKTPRQYAWDGTSIAERYSNLGTTTWGKYTTTPKAAQKNIAKAYSAHGNATANEGGWGAQGLDGAITNYRDGNQNVQCYDCHSSHGSAVAGITSSYVSFSGDKNGGNLKETQDGFGGYTTTYKASKNLLPAAINQYQPGSGQCFDCHETPDVGLKPWGYNSTFGATTPVIGYNDTLSFAKTILGETVFKASQKRYGFKASRPMVGGHLRAETAMTTTVTGSINGLCTPCHDPHGVSPTLGAGMAYAVPLLKGTWLTSPYQEDTAPDNLTGTDRFKYTSFADYPFDYAVWKPTYWIDQNTFGPGTGIYPGQNGGEANTWDWNTPTKITESDTQFAGLCLKCHPRDNIDPDTTTTWRTMDRVHETVKGWGGQGQNAGNAVHAYTCSKCHQPHVSGLPRLMVTDCLDDEHKGKLPSGGTAANSRLNYTSSRGKGGGTFPYGGFGNEGQPPSYGWGYYSTNHSIGFGGGYNLTLSTCHYPAGPEGGADGWRLRQRWNNVTQW